MFGNYNAMPLVQYSLCTTCPSAAEILESSHVSGIKLSYFLVLRDIANGIRQCFVLCRTVTSANEAAKAGIPLNYHQDNAQVCTKFEFFQTDFFIGVCRF